MVSKVKAKSQSQIIRERIASHPKETISEVAKATGSSYTLVYDVLKRLKAKKQARKAQPVEKPVDTPAAPPTEKPKADMVNHPPHYTGGGIETIDFIEAKRLGYHLGNVVKYITRAEHKGNTYEDLCKARWYLNREIDKVAKTEGK